MTTGTDALRAHGLRVTAARLAVLDALDGGGHLSADEVAAAARERTGSVTTQGIYLLLATLTDAGLLRRIEPAGSAARYERRVGDNHHHLVCRSCGLIVDVDCARPDPPCLAPADDHGFAVDEAEVVYWGRCADCAAPETPRTEGNTA